MRMIKLLGTTAAVATLPAMAMAAHVNSYMAEIEPLNGSGVTGSAMLTVDTTAQTLAFDMQLMGLEPNQLHVQHIHGAFNEDGSNKQSIEPTLADDARGDGDGFIELLEAFPSYGPIVVPLSDPETGMFPMTADGNISFSYLYDLTDAAIFGDNILTDDPDDKFDISSLLPLTMREIIIHGLSLGPVGMAPGEADGIAGYKTVLPVAYGQIVPVPVPLPAAGLFLLAGLGGLGLVRSRRSA